MPRRRLLRSVAGGLSGKFVSRYNDVKGYWALGVLYDDTSKRFFGRLKQSQFELNILTGDSSPKLKYSKHIAAPLAEFLRGQLDRVGLDAINVVNAVVVVKFSASSADARIIRDETWGEPFTCKVSITDDLGKIHTSERHGLCGIHDKSRESKSSRAPAT